MNLNICLYVEQGFEFSSCYLFQRGILKITSCITSSESQFKKMSLRKKVPAPISVNFQGARALLPFQGILPYCLKTFS